MLGFARLVTGARAQLAGVCTRAAPAHLLRNHNSHADFALIWTALPPSLLRLTRPVAGADYWTVGPLRPFLVHRVFRAVLVAPPAGHPHKGADPP